MSTTPPTDPTQPTEVYPPAPQGQPASDPQAYGAPPTGPDTRPKGIAWTALILSIAGILLSLIGFVPVLWVGLISVVIGGLVLLAAFILSIVGLVGKRNGGKPLSITALVLSVLGGVVGASALVVSLVFVGLTVSGAGPSGSTPAPAPSSQASDSASGDATDDAADPGDGTTSAGEAAFLAEVRPQIGALLAEIDPTVTPESIASVFSDADLVTIGQALLTTGEGGIDAFVEQTTAAAGGAVDADKVRELFETLYAAAQTHLQ